MKRNQTTLQLKLQAKDYIDLKYILCIASDKQLRETARMLGTSIGKYKVKTLENIANYLTDNRMTLDLTITSNK